MKKHRIWELDAARGLCLVGMIGFHFWYDLVYIFGLVPLRMPGFFRLICSFGAIPFFLISGISTFLGSRTVRRGIAVLCGGVAVSAVTLAGHLLGFAGPEIRIYFGILHCLGTCMLLWMLLRQLPDRALMILSASVLALGLWLRYCVRARIPWLLPLGVIWPEFASADYFPLMPNLAYFLVGAVIGRNVYARRQTRFPKVNTQNPAIRFLTLLGRHSLPVYLLHQPALFLLLILWQHIF